MISIIEHSCSCIIEFNKLVFPTRLMNSIKSEHSCNILYIYNVHQPTCWHNTYHCRIPHYAIMHVRNKNRNIQGRSPYVVRSYIKLNRISPKQYLVRMCFLHNTFVLRLFSTIPVSHWLLAFTNERNIYDDVD